jgi:multiple sugar transport system substrate-binding protein
MTPIDESLKGEKGMAGKKWISIALAMAMTAAMTACGGPTPGKETQSGSGEPTKQPAANVDKTPVELTITSSGALDPAVFDKNIGQYLAKKFPNYKFTYIQKVSGKTEITDLLAANTPIDLIYETIGGERDGLIAPKLAMDISDLMKKHNVDVGRFEPALIQGMRDLAGGGLYGLPVGNLVMVTYYNKDLFDKFGVNYPKDGLTWDETLDLAKKMTRTQDGQQYLGLVTSPTHILRLNQYSLPYVDAKTGKSTYSNEKWKTLLQTVIRGEAQPEGYKEYMGSIKNKLPYKDEFLKNKNLALFVYLCDLQNAYPDMDTMNWDMIAAPTFKELPKVGTQPYPTYWNIASISKHKDEAMEVIKYLTSDEWQLLTSKRGELTSVKSEDVKKAYGQDYKKPIHWSSVFYNNMAPISPKTEYDTITEKPLSDLLPKVAMDSIDLNTALRQAEDAANKAISEYKSK